MVVVQVAGLEERRGEARDPTLAGTFFVEESEFARCPTTQKNSSLKEHLHRFSSLPSCVEVALCILVSSVIQSSIFGFREASK